MRLRQEVQALPRRLTLLLVLLALATAGFVGLAASYDGWLGDVDTDVARWVASDLPGFLVTAARPFSWLGGWIGLTVLCVAAIAVLVHERSWLDLAFFVAAFLGSQLVASLLKNGFDRARPDAGSAVPLPDSSSFPSGHATAGAASLGAVAVLLAERLPSRRARVWLWVVTVALGVIVGLSRIALGVHYLTDVLAGWCLGVAWLAACLIVRDLARARTVTR